MSGDDEAETQEWFWGHYLWQKRGIRFEEFVEMNHNTRLMYIASEILSTENPVLSTDRLAKAFIRTNSGGNR